MKESSKIAAFIFCVLAATGCALPACAVKNEEYVPPENFEETENSEEVQENTEHTSEENNSGKVTVTEALVPETKKAEYIMVTADGVNIRSGAGADYKRLGTAEENALYALAGQSGNWYKIYYKNGSAYVNTAYCVRADMEASANKAVEDVIKEGCKRLGVDYVYGAVRYHDGTGRRLSGFTPYAFDCSSLMQYIFKTGAGVNLQVNTRTQVYQGTTVKKSQIKRGDLLFFTNASRSGNTGIERIGHVALYLGDNYILHTASDYAKIEKISSSRWGYYIQAQRIL